MTRLTWVLLLSILSLLFTACSGTLDLKVGQTVVVSERVTVKVTDKQPGPTIFLDVTVKLQGIEIAKTEPSLNFRGDVDGWTVWVKGGDGVSTIYYVRELRSNYWLKPYFSPNNPYEGVSVVVRRVDWILTRE